MCLVETKSRGAWELRKKLEPSTVKSFAFVFSVSLFLSLLIHFPL